MHPALERFLQQFKATSEAIIDSWFVCDRDKKIVDYNRVFFAMFPRQEARTLKGRVFSEVLRLSIDQNACIVEQCWREKRHVRLDEISGSPLGPRDDLLQHGLEHGRERTQIAERGKAIARNTYDAAR